MLNIFYGCSGLTSVTIPGSVTSIGSYAFSGCSGLTSVTIEDGSGTLSFSTSSNSTPFTDCPIEKLYLGRDISYSSSYSPFRGKEKLTSLTIGSSVTSIGSSAFSGCSGLTSVTIPGSVTSIGSSAFSGCSLKLVKLLADNPPAGTIETNSIEVPFGRGCIYAMDNNWNKIDTIYSIQMGKKYYPIPFVVNGESIVSVNGTTELSALEIEEGKKVEISANNELAQYGLVMQYCSDVSDEICQKGKYTFISSPYHKENKIETYAYPTPVIELSESGTLLTQIGNKNIVDVYSLKIIGDVNGTDILTIRKMSNLRLLDLEEANIVNGGTSYYQDYITSNNKIGEYFFGEKEKLKRVILPNSVTSIGSSAFSGCSGLTSVTIPGSVTSIGYSAFWACSALTSVTIEDGSGTLSFSTSSSSTPFTGCPIEKLYLGRDIRYSSSYSPFKGKEKLTSLTIGSSVTSIGSSAFSGCSGLTSVTSLNTTPPVISSTTFDTTTEQNATLNVPVGCEDIYWLHPYWENFYKIEGIDVTAIQSVIGENHVNEGENVYNLNGERMAVDADNIQALPKGVYIVNGRKIYVK